MVLYKIVKIDNDKITCENLHNNEVIIIDKHSINIKDFYKIKKNTNIEITEKSSKDIDPNSFDEKYLKVRFL